MTGRLQTAKYGPFTKGVIDTANPSLDLRGSLKKAKGLRYAGVGQLRVRGGSVLAMTFKDDAGTPANVTSICAIVTFADGALVVAHSTVQNEAYLYRVNSTLTGWYNAAGALQSNTNAEPIGVLWSSITTSPDVFIAEGLGVAYIAHADGATAAALSFPTKTYTQPGTIATWTADLDVSGGAEDIYALGVASFKNHVWFWGFGSGTTAANGYRPELARYSGPSFTTPIAADSITLGDRVRSAREKIVCGVVAGDALFLGAPFKLSRVTGFGRNSWAREQLGDDKYGIVGPKAACKAGDWFYAWGPRGPYRCLDAGKPEPLWDRIAAAVASAVNVAKIVAAFDEGEDLVKFFYDVGTGVRTIAAYDVVRECWLGPDDDIGLAIRHACTVSPVTASTAAPATGPAGAPTTASTTAVGSLGATANWVAGDPAAATRVEYRRQVDTAWILVAELPAGVTSTVIGFLGASTAYEWRAAHVKDGITSAYLGPSASTQFTTTAATGGGGGDGLATPTGLDLAQSGGDGSATIVADWNNSESAPAATEVQLAGPSASEPSDGSFGTVNSVDCPASSTNVVTLTGSEASGRYWVRIRHTRSGYTESDWTAAVSIDVTITGDAL